MVFVGQQYMIPTFMSGRSVAKDITVPGKLVGNFDIRRSVADLDRGIYGSLELVDFFG